MKREIKNWELNLVRGLAVFFTIVYIVSDFLPILLEFLQCVELIYLKVYYDSIVYFCWLLKWILPALVGMSWFMYIERYSSFRKKYYEETFYSKGKKTEIRPNIELTIIVTVILGIMTFFQYQALKYFWIKNWNLLDGLLKCSILKIVLLILWFTFLVIWIRRAVEYEIIDNEKSDKIRFGLVAFICLIIVTLTTEINSFQTAKKVYEQKKTEFYKENSEDVGLFKRTSENFRMYLDNLE